MRAYLVYSCWSMRHHCCLLLHHRSSPCSITVLPLAASLFCRLLHHRSAPCYIQSGTSAPATPCCVPFGPLVTHVSGAPLNNHSTHNPNHWINTLRILYHAGDEARRPPHGLGEDPRPNRTRHHGRQLQACGMTLLFKCFYRVLPFFFWGCSMVHSPCSMVCAPSL